MESTGFPAPCTSNSFLLFFTLRVIHDPGQSFGVHIWFLKTWQHPVYHLGSPQNAGSVLMVVGSGQKSYTCGKLFEAGAATAP